MSLTKKQQVQDNLRKKHLQDNIQIDFLANKISPSKKHRMKKLEQKKIEKTYLEDLNKKINLLLSNIEHEKVKQERLKEELLVKFQDLLGSELGRLLEVHYVFGEALSTEAGVCLHISPGLSSLLSCRNCST